MCQYDSPSFPIACMYLLVALYFPLKTLEIFHAVLLKADVAFSKCSCGMSPRATSIASISFKILFCLHMIPPQNVADLRATLEVLDEFRERVLPYHELYPIWARSVF